MDYLKEYRRWLECAPAFKAELEAMDEKTVEDAFYRDLEFGTAGLRGVLGAGTNRMNEYVVARASQGLANYVNAAFPDGVVSKSYVALMDRVKRSAVYCIMSAVCL